MPSRKHGHVGVLALAMAMAIACGDSGGSDDDDASTTAPASTTATETSGSPTSDPSTSGTAPESTSVAPESSSDGSDASSSSTGTPGDTVTLQNDGFTPEMTLFWQTWPMPDDCWASTYEIDAGLYPFDIVGLYVAIGGSTDIVTMEVGIWSVDGDGLPDQPIDSAMIEVEGEAQNDIDVETLLDVPPVMAGSFAVVMCHVDHMGAPSIGIDQDGTVDAAHNFIRDDGGDWVPSPDFFNTDGDFILRAIVRPS
jgi:hypothetical protein